MATCPRCRTAHPEGALVCPGDGGRVAANEARVDPDLPAGTAVGEYVIERTLGRGGFGTVYEAVHPLIGKHVAIKILRGAFADCTETVGRFVAEARAVNHIGHRGIIDIFGFGNLDDGRLYYVMELLKGETLKSHLKCKGRLNVEQALAIVGEIARALDAAHAAGIAHRDLKPDNVMLADDGEGGYSPKLLDFGIAKLLGAGTDSNVTQSGIPIGTPLYMSPEQCRGKPVDHRTDLYSLGVVTHEMLTGRPPFVGDTVLDVMMAQTMDAPAPMSLLRPDLPAELDEPILHLLRKDPAMRPSSAGAAFDALAAAAARAGYSIPAPRREGRLRHSDSARRPASARGAEPDPSEPLAAVGRSLVGAAKEVAQARAPRRRLTALVVAGVGAASIAGAIVWRARGPTLRGSPAVVAQAVAGPTTAVVTSAPAVETAPPPVDVLALGIEVRIEGAPADARVLLDGKVVGLASTAVPLARASGPVALVVDADGYEPWTVRVTPTADVVVPVRLEKKAAAKGGPAKSPSAPKAMGEIENPFR